MPKNNSVEARGPYCTRKYKTPEEFEAAVDEYREECLAADRPLTFSGLARALGFASRQSLYDYGKREGFSYAVQRAKLLVTEQLETIAYRRTNGQVAGVIFGLKNHGWTDRQHVDVDHSGEVTHKHDDARERLAGRIAGIAARAGTDGVAPGPNGAGVIEA